PRAHHRRAGVAEPLFEARLDPGDQLRLRLPAGFEDDVARSPEGPDRLQSERLELPPQLVVGHPAVAEVHPPKERGVDQPPAPPGSQSTGPAVNRWAPSGRPS